MARPRRSPALLVVALVAACAVRGGAHSPPPPPPPAEPHLFRANDSLLGTRVRCSEDERECLRYNRLLDVASGKCFRVGSRGPCAQADAPAPAPAVFLLDKAEFEARGRLVGVCADPGRCPDRRFRMAWDGRCYSGKQVFGEFCDVRAGASAWPYFFGGYECVCDGARCPAASYVQQPPRRGECRFPNFRKDLSSGFFPRLPGDDLRCSAAQSWCFSNGQVAFGEDGKCYELLARGPCSPRQHLVLDKQQAFLNRKIATLCVPVERCPAGFRFMTQRQKCVNETKIKNVMCPELNFFTDVFGDTVCRFEEEFYKVELTSPQEGLCKLRYNVQLRDLKEETKSDCTDPLECLPLEEIPPDVLDEKLRA